jgi:Phage tail assembly chaperone proteins, E, or 41 or 14
MPQPMQREGFVPDDEEPKKVSPIKTVETAQPMVMADPEPEPDPEPFITKWPMRIKLLHRPIRNNKNEEISEVTFREPSGGDINRYGSPIRMSPDGMFDIEDKKMAMLMAALSGINLPFLERMDPRDWNSCAYRLKLYFQPDTTGWL